MYSIRDDMATGTIESNDGRQNFEMYDKSSLQETESEKQDIEAISFEWPLINIYTSRCLSKNDSQKRKSVLNLASMQGV